MKRWIVVLAVTASLLAVLITTTWGLAHQPPKHRVVCSASMEAVMDPNSACYGPPA